MTDRKIELLPLGAIESNPDNPKAADAAEVAESWVDEAAIGRGADGCWPWPHTRSQGDYGVFMWQRRQYVAMRVILGIEDAGKHWQVCHSCDNPPCVNPAHLSIGTIVDNQKDKGRRGRAAKGERNGGGGRLTETDVRSIREEAERGVTQKQLGERFGVSAAMIGHITRGRAWRHVV